MWDSATILLGGFGLLAAIFVLIAGIKSDNRPFKSCCAKRGFERDE